MIKILNIAEKMLVQGSCYSNGGGYCDFEDFLLFWVYNNKSLYRFVREPLLEVTC